METDAVLLCYRGGFLGWLAVWTAIGTPRFLWAGLSWMSSHSLDLYWLLLASGWLLVTALQFVVATFWLDRHEHTALECNNDLRAMPDLSVWLLLHYLATIGAHEFAYGEWPGWWTLAWRVVYIVGVPGVLLWSRNTKWLYALAGAGFGLASGLLFAALLLVLWLPRIHDANATVYAVYDWARSALRRPRSYE